MLLLIINLILNLLFSSIEGIREGIFFSANVNSSSPYKGPIHTIFTFLRMCFWLLTGLFVFVVSNYILKINFEYSIFHATFLLMAEFLMFSMLHDGFYYIARNKLDSSVYPKGFFDSSTSSTALMEFGFLERLIMFIVGISIYLTIIFI